MVVAILNVNSFAGSSALGISEEAKQGYVDSFRKFNENRLLKAEPTLKTESDLTGDSSNNVKRKDKELYIVDGLYRVKIGVVNDGEFPKSPHKYNPKYPVVGGVSQSELDSFFSQHYKEIMEEYFSDDYLTFYQIKILNINSRFVSFEVLVRNAAEFELTLKDRRITFVGSVVNKSLELIE